MKKTGVNENTAGNVSGRLFYLDNLKIFLTMLVIVHHVGQAYGPTGGFWQYRSSLHESIPWLGSFFGVNAGFFMGLFFMISGYFLPSSFDRKSFSEFLKEKLIRFGIPLLFVFTVLQPFQMYFYYVNYSGNRPMDFLSYYIHIYFGAGGRPDWFADSIGFPEMNFGHLWFVEHLLVYFIIYAVVKKYFIKKKTEVVPTKITFFHIIGLGLLISITSVLIRIFYPIDRWTGILGFIQSEPAHLPQYLLLFITGVTAYRKDWLRQIKTSTGMQLLSAGVMMALVVYFNGFLPKAVINIVFEGWSIYESFMAVFLCFGLTVLFREHAEKSSMFMKAASRNSYAAYIIHFPVVLTVQFALDRVNICGAYGKFFTVSILSVLLSYSLSALIRKSSLMRKVL
ncbi:MAG: acyltransferase [Spirochaetes bacterium]|nr:acyltransferase [Spirochaetota bacterium]